MEAINASLKTACYALAGAHSRGVEAWVLGDIYNCTLPTTKTYKKIMAYYIRIGSATDITNAFWESAVGDVVEVEDASVAQYSVYSNQAGLHCTADLMADDKDFTGYGYPSEGSGRITDAFAYTRAVNRCNSLVDAYFDEQTVDIRGTVRNPTSSSDSSINTTVRITRVE